MRLELVHGIGEVGAVANDLPVHEDRHVSAQRRLIVEYVPARLRVPGKDVSSTSRTVHPGASASGQATWRCTLGVNTTLAILVPPSGQFPRPLD